MKTMPHVDDVLARYCEGALPKFEAREVERHLASCAACRAAEVEVRRGLALARGLGVVRLPEEAAKGIRRTLESAPRVRRTPGWLGVAAALAAAALLVTVRPWRRAPEWPTPASQPGLGGLLFEPDLGATTRFEQMAFDLHDAHEKGRLTLDLRSSSVPEVRRWSESAGLGVSLALDRPPEEQGRYVVEGARKVRVGDVAALAVAYRVDGRPVTLLTAKASDVADRTPDWNPGGKRVRFRAWGQRRLLAWTNAGQTYALVSESPGYGQGSCLLCHTTAARREAIEALGRTSPP